MVWISLPLLAAGAAAGPFLSSREKLTGLHCSSKLSGQLIGETDIVQGIAAARVEERSGRLNKITVNLIVSF